MARAAACALSRALERCKAGTPGLTAICQILATTKYISTTPCPKVPKQVIAHNPRNHSFICSLTHSFVHLSTLQFIHPPIHPFIHLLRPYSVPDAEKDPRTKVIIFVLEVLTVNLLKCHHTHRYSQTVRSLNEVLCMLAGSVTWRGGA